ncbi:SPL family radical SAM protein [Desulfolutivibrio sulfoxidireducens]|uniref:SPL family radical SAM protein n=1 Tax=Desulfolutivibrio sulfoxidireducens TaxID=2773299 RepID=UPI00159E18FB|nr:radical SAM protein [Desulfolutivibrio sulfoxidireducens]QLA21198.1 radical SAM protein [Desulfolutivibrio sulfoxidireducens]
MTPDAPAGPPANPANPWNIRAVFVDQAVAGSAMARRVRQRLPEAAFQVVEDSGPSAPGHPSGCGPSGGPGPGGESGRVLRLSAHRGRFLRPCPGAKSYRCCGYRIVHIGEGCPMDCTYCILKAYLRTDDLRVFANTPDMFAELGDMFGRDRSRRFRVGTGEFADSLALESVTGHTAELLEFLRDLDNVVVELKTKTADLSWMAASPRPDRVLAAWSVNAPDIVAGQERGAPPLSARLAAAREAARAGFGVCLHFDPIVPHPGWEKGYAATVDMIASFLRPRDIVYISLGSLRFLPELPAGLAAMGRLPDYYLNEFVEDLDGKRRLVRPLRVRQLRHVAGLLQKCGLAGKLYLCMESDEVWRAVLGRAPHGPDGLARRLMELAFEKRRDGP